MAKLIAVTTGTYSNKNAVDNTIKYITRTREGENRRDELLIYGSPNVTIYSDNESDAISKAIREFKDIQRFFAVDGIKGRRVYHEILSMLDEEAQSFTNLYQIELFALECSHVYDVQGHQVVYASHYSENLRLHIHFIVNTYNYASGHKFHSYFSDCKSREEIFNEILQKHIRDNKKIITGYSWY